jgi:hypothetical protein
MQLAILGVLFYNFDRFHRIHSGSHTGIRQLNKIRINIIISGHHHHHHPCFFKPSSSMMLVVTISFHSFVHDYGAMLE